MKTKIKKIEKFIICLNLISSGILTTASWIFKDVWTGVLGYGLLNCTIGFALLLMVNNIGDKIEDDKRLNKKTKR